MAKKKEDFYWCVKRYGHPCLETVSTSKNYVKFFHPNVPDSRIIRIAVREVKP